MYDPDLTLDVEMMCLANRYATGHHYISRHGDKQFQASNEVRDIVCWVTGATRRLIIREDGKRGVKLLELNVPAGIYIMGGYHFQDRYTHEIPQEKEALFNKLLDIVPTELIEASQGGSKLLAADWLAANPQEVEELLPHLYDKYWQWSWERCSYTIRFFANAEERRRRGYA